MSKGAQLDIIEEYSNHLQGTFMKTDQKNICKQIKKLNNNELSLYAKTLRQSLIDAGVDNKTVDQAIKRSVQSFKALSQFETHCAQLLENGTCSENPKENRGIDAIGRILVEYCFLRTSTQQMLWPDNSTNDQQSREKFVQGIIPRPLMRYFLVSVRGSIAELNKFEASSVLFGEENEIHEERKKYVDTLVKEFQATNDSTSNKSWNKIYEDPRFQKAALDLIGDIRRKMVQFGLERYLRIIENFRQRDPDSKSSNIMFRPFIIEDIRQLDDALWAAEEGLAKSLD